MSRERIDFMKRCKFCGAYLDPGENCDCQKVQEDNTEKEESEE